MTTTVDFYSIAATHMVACAIVGAREPVDVEIAGQVVRFKVADYSEIRVPGASSITIERPSNRYGSVAPAQVSWSSSSSAGSDAQLTADLLRFADSVRLTLDEWMRDGLLPYLDEPEFA